MLGRRTQRTHPDAGTTTWEYDKASNLVSVVTANLDQIGSIEYRYDYNRLDSVVYPQYPINNVKYIYGQPNDYSYNRGRLVMMEDATGLQEFEYGPMGELVRNRHTFIVPDHDAYTFETRWVYDSWGRLDSLTYPDGEVVTYSYDDGGMLKGMEGIKGSTPYIYVDNVNYDKFGRRTNIYYGNNTYSTYAYNDQSGRLERLVSVDANQDTMQDLNYSFDHVGNITGLLNTADVLPNGLGGEVAMEFGYDNLYRLISSAGNWNQSANFALSMEYSNSGMITRKEQSADLDIAGTQSSINYNNDYSYLGGTHRIENIQSSTSSEHHQITWDANGNMTGHTTQIADSEINRMLCWDEENRLRGVSDNNSLSYYLYSAGIDRAMKLSGSWTQMQVNEFTVVDVADLTDFKLYTSPYMVIDEQGYTKHYYIEGERVSSKLGGGLLGVMVDFDSVVVGFEYTDRDDYNEKRDLLQEDILTLSECMDVSDYINISFSVDWLDNNPNVDEPESQQYFFHSDHLGSSSFISDGAGEASQFLAYLPFGEQWIEQQRVSFTTEYKFSGKELDAETGYNYFGARYYDSGLSVWLSVDPLADKYQEVSPYSYTLSNPVGLIDRYGEEPESSNLNQGPGPLAYLLRIYPKYWGKNGKERWQNKLRCSPTLRNGSIFKNRTPNGRRRFDIPVLTVTRYRIIENNQEFDQIPETWNIPSSNSYDINPSNSYSIKYDFHVVPDQMNVSYVNSEGSTVNISTEENPGEGEIHIPRGSKDLNIEVLPNPSKSGNETVYDYTIYTEPNHVTRIQSKRWLGFIPIGRDKNKIKFNHNSEYKRKTKWN